MSDSVRPASFADFVGQDKPKRVLQILCASAKKRGGCVPHCLLSGPPGMGKSSLGRIISAELGGRLIETVGGNVQSPDHIAAELTGLKPNDVLFIDEIHALPRSVEELLYPAMEDGKVPVARNGYDDLMKSLGMPKREPTTQMVDLPPFTLIGASTLSGLVSEPLRSRFCQILQLEPYSDEELRIIVMNAAAKLQFRIMEKAAMEIARRSRSTARNAVGNLKWIVEYCTATGSKPDPKTLDAAFDLKDIDAHGLTKLDRSYLSLLVAAKSPVGLSTLAVSLGESEETLERGVEPFLLRRGFVRKMAKGRVAEARAVEALGRVA